MNFKNGRHYFSWIIADSYTDSYTDSEDDDFLSFRERKFNDLEANGDTDTNYDLTEFAWGWTLNIQRRVTHNLKHTIMN